MHDYYDLRAQKPKRDPTLFAVVLAVVFKREQRTFEDMLSVDEVQSMLLEVGLPLGFVPKEPHHPNYAYEYAYFNANHPRATAVTAGGHNSTGALKHQGE